MGLFLTGLTLGLFGYAGSVVYSAFQERMERQPPSRRASEQIYAVNVKVGESATVVPKITTFGEVRSLRTLELRAPASGAIIELSPNFVEGGVFAEGEFILAVDPSDAKVAVDLAVANQDDAEVQLNDARRDLAIAREEQSAAEHQVELREQSLARQNLLRGRGVTTDTAVEAAELALSAAGQALLTRKKTVAQAETRVEQTQSLLRRQAITLGEARRKLAETRLKAEFAGTLTNVNLVQGRLVNAKERIAQLVDPDSIEVAFRVSSEQYSRIVGDDGRLRPLEVNVKGVSLKAQATIVRESAIVAPGQTGRLLFASLRDNRRSGLRPGDFVEVEIAETSLNNVFVLPAEAADSQSQILVVAEGERLEEREANIIRKQGDEIIVSADDLIGRMIVTKRTPVIGSGIRVRPVLPENASIPNEPQLVSLTSEEREDLMAFVKNNQRMPEAAKKRVLEQLGQEEVPQATLDRLRARMGG